MVYPDPNRPDILARAEGGLTPWVYEPALGPNGEPGEYICAHGIRKWRPVPVFSPEEYTPPEPYPLTVPPGDDAAVAEEEALGESDEILTGTRRGTAETAVDAVGRRPQGGPDDAGPLHPDASHRGPPLRAAEELPERTWRSIDFTPPRRAVFLHHLAEQGNVRAACSRVGISPQAVYLARRRDPIFCAGWDAALVHSRDHALQVLANQALEGVREEVWHRGELVGHRVRHDTRLLLAHLGRLDARCKNARAQARAERFDELLALVAGEDFGCSMRDVSNGSGECDEILPIARDHHSARAADATYGEDPYDLPVTIDQAELDAREAAEAEWDEWGRRVDAVNAAIEAGEEPVVAVPGDEPPYEVKSLDGIPPRFRRRFRSARMAGLGGIGSGAEFFARTPFRSSTCSTALGCREG